MTDHQRKLDNHPNQNETLIKISFNDLRRAFLAGLVGILIGLIYLYNKPDKFTVTVAIDMPVLLTSVNNIGYRNENSIHPAKELINSLEKSRIKISSLCNINKGGMGEYPANVQLVPNKENLYVLNINVKADSKQSAYACMENVISFIDEFEYQSYKIMKSKLIEESELIKSYLADMTRYFSQAYKLGNEAPSFQFPTILQTRKQLLRLQGELNLTYVSFREQAKTAEFIESHGYLKSLSILLSLFLASTCTTLLIANCRPKLIFKIVL